MGSGAKIGASEVKIGNPCRMYFFTSLSRGGYFEALLGVLKDPNFGRHFLMS